MAPCVLRLILLHDTICAARARSRGHGCRCWTMWRHRPPAWRGLQWEAPRPRLQQCATPAAVPTPPPRTARVSPCWQHAAAFFATYPGHTCLRASARVRGAEEPFVRPMGLSLMLLHAALLLPFNEQHRIDSAQILCLAQTATNTNAHAQARRASRRRRSRSTTRRSACALPPASRQPACSPPSVRPSLPPAPPCPLLPCRPPDAIAGRKLACSSRIKWHDAPASKDY